MPSITAASWTPTLTLYEHCSILELHLIPLILQDWYWEQTNTQPQNHTAIPVATISSSIMRGLLPSSINCGIPLALFLRHIRETFPAASNTFLDRRRNLKTKFFNFHPNLKNFASPAKICKNLIFAKISHFYLVRTDFVRLYKHLSIRLYGIRTLYRIFRILFLL